MSWPYYGDPDYDDPDYQALAEERRSKGRIEPGEIRNPQGRPKGRRNRALIVRKVALEKHAVMEKGRRRKRTAIEIVLLMIRTKAIKGDAAAMKLFDGLQIRFSTRETVPPSAAMILPEKMSEEQFAEWCQRQEDQRSPEEIGCCDLN